MGLFDYFTKEGRLRRHVRRMADRDTPPEDREASAQWLAGDGSPEAILGLLSRYDMSLSQQLKDRNEKDATLGLLIGLGDDVIEPARTWLRRCKQIAYPLRLIIELAGEEVAVDAVYERLEIERERGGFSPEIKVDLLVWLADHPHSRAIEVASPFLQDFDEGVRYAAAEVLIAQKDDGARPLLLAALSKPEEDSNRLKHRLCEVFRLRDWSVDGAELTDRLPADFALSGSRIVTR